MSANSAMYFLTQNKPTINKDFNITAIRALHKGCETYFSFAHNDRHQHGRRELDFKRSFDLSPEVTKEISPASLNRSREA